MPVWAVFGRAILIPLISLPHTCGLSPKSNHSVASHNRTHYRAGLILYDYSSQTYKDALTKSLLLRQCFIICMNLQPLYSRYVVTSHTILGNQGIKTLATPPYLANFHYFNSRNNCESLMVAPYHASASKDKSNPFKIVLLTIMLVMALGYVGYWFSQMVF
jgi:hypothetical protein